MSRKMAVRQKIVLERITPVSAWDDSSVLSQVGSEFEDLIEPILEELRERGLLVRVEDADTFLVEGGDDD